MFIIICSAPLLHIQYFPSLLSLLAQLIRSQNYADQQVIIKMPYKVMKLASLMKIKWKETIKKTIFKIKWRFSYLWKVSVVICYYVCKCMVGLGCGAWRGVVTRRCDRAKMTCGCDRAKMTVRCHGSQMAVRGSRDQMLTIRGSRVHTAPQFLTAVSELILKI